MAQVIGREHAKGQVYNIQHPQAVTFDGVARLAAQAAGKGTYVHVYTIYVGLLCCGVVWCGVLIDRVEWLGG